MDSPVDIKEKSENVAKEQFPVIVWKVSAKTQIRCGWQENCNCMR